MSNILHPKNHLKTMYNNMFYLRKIHHFSKPSMCHPKNSHVDRGMMLPSLMTHQQPLQPCPPCPSSYGSKKRRSPATWRLRTVCLTSFEWTSWSFFHVVFSPPVRWGLLDFMYVVFLLLSSPPFLRSFLLLPRRHPCRPLRQMSPDANMILKSVVGNAGPP